MVLQTSEVYNNNGVKCGHKIFEGNFCRPPKASDTLTEHVPKIQGIMIEKCS